MGGVKRMALGLAFPPTAPMAYCVLYREVYNREVYNGSNVRLLSDEETFL
jgi:hypothetical protein